MRLITLEEQIALVTKIDQANALMMDPLNIISYKLDRCGISVYVMKDCKVERYMSVDVVEWLSTVEDDLRQIHAELDRIINECNEKRMDRFAGAMATA